MILANSLLKSLIQGTTMGKHKKLNERKILNLSHRNAFSGGDFLCQCDVPNAVLQEVLDFEEAGLME